MNIVYNARVGLIRFAKVFPFCLCFLTFVSLSETLIALSLQDYAIYDGGITLNTPLSWMIASKYEMGVYSVLAAIYLSVTFECCIWNRLSEVYLLVFLKEQVYFPTIELYEEYIYAICLTNIIVSGFFCYKGLKILNDSRK